VTRPANWREAARFTALFTILLPVLSCSSGDGNDGLLNRFPREATFASDVTGVRPDGQVELRQVASSGATLEVILTVRNVVNLWALAFTLEYDPRILRFDSTENIVPNGFLGPDYEVELVAEEPPGRTDRVIVGITRLANPPAPRLGKTGTGDVMRLRFSLEGVGTTSLRFVPSLAGKDPDDVTVLVPDQFYGGTVTTR
jgi:hypothetical protein